jgi:class 3 adenylate cyclase
MWRNDIASEWGTIDFARRWVEDEAPSLANDEDYVRWFAKNLRHSASPAAALEFDEVWYALDVRGILGTVQAPTLVLQRASVFAEGVEPSSRYLAERIPGARYEELPGRDHIIIAGDAERVVQVTERFVRSIRAEETEFERALATVLFTDIVGSTERAASAGDASWKTLLERHHEVVRALLGRYRGREIDTAGDGFFASFDGPARAVRCAVAIVEAVGSLGIEVRAGLHTGEVETIDGKVGGLAVIIGARVGTKAGPSQIFVSQTVKDLVAGSPLVFQDAGDHELKGVPDQWHLYRVIE